MLAGITNTRDLVRPIKKITCILSIVATLVVLPLYGYKVFTKKTYSDFDVYHRTSYRINHQQWDLVYNFKIDKASPFRYSPLSWPFFVEFDDYPLPVARTIWFVMNYLFYAIGFFFLFRSLARLKIDTFFVTAFSFIFVLRFCLDSFMIGQISGLMFMCIAITLDAWLTKNPKIFGIALTIPTILKVGPGVIAGLLLGSRSSFAKVTIRYAAYTIAGLATLSLFFYEISFLKYCELFVSWFQTVVADANYFDASHYGSQSLKSTLLRIAKQQWITFDFAVLLWKTLSASFVCILAAFWLIRRPITLRARGLFFCLGIFAYLICMPETFKYALTLLAFPIAFLMSGQRARFENIAVAFGFLTMSIAGYDVIGPALFFPLQKASIPFLAIILLLAATLRLTLRESAPSSFWLNIRDLWSIPRTPYGFGLNRKKSETKKDFSFVIPVPLSSTTQTTPYLLQYSLKQVLTIIQRLTPQSYEIILVPYGNHASGKHPIIQKSIVKLPLEVQEQVYITPTLITQLRRGAALQQGYQQTYSNLICVFNIEQPCSSAFYLNAIEKVLSRQADIVRADRRHPESEWVISIPLIHKLNRRFNLSIQFNRLVRLLLPIPTHDLHSFNIVMTCRFASILFVRQMTTALLFDVDMSLIAQTHGFKEIDLPALFVLEKEKRLARLNLEILRFVVRIPVILWRYHAGYFAPLKHKPQFTADDWGLSPAVNRGILSLAQAGVVKRVSILAKSKFLSVELEELKKIPNIKLGLHFDLTYSPSQSPFKIIFESVFSGKTKKEALRTLFRHEFLTQLQILRQHHINPIYMDGHHHIHLVPGTLNSIGDLIQDAQITRVRLPYSHSLWFSKKFLINILSIFALKHFKKFNFQYSAFYYPLKREMKDINFLISQINANPKSEIICHPALYDDSGPETYTDSYTDQRVSELHTLQNLAILNEQKILPTISKNHEHASPHSI